MNDDFLNQFQESPRREFATELYQRISKPMPKQSAFNSLLVRRAALAFGAVALLFMATLLFSPSARAFAGEQLRQIGAFLFRPVDSSVPETQTEAQPTVAAPEGLTAQFAVSAAEASELAGFVVVAPGYLPAGYEQRGTWSVDERDGSVYVAATYVAEGGRHFLMMNQTLFAKGAVFEQTYGDNETVSDVAVGQYPGVFISGRLMAHPDRPTVANGERPDLLSTNWLIWEANGVTYSLFGDNLDQSELIQIAESLVS